MTGNILFQACCSFSNISPVEKKYTVEVWIFHWFSHYYSWYKGSVNWCIDGWCADVLMVGVLRYAMSVWSVCWVDWENLQQETASIRDKFAAWGDLLVGQREECCIVDLSLSDWYALASYLLGIPWHWEQTEPSTVLHLMSALKKTLKNPKNTGSKRNLSVQMPWRHF